MIGRFDAVVREFSGSDRAVSSVMGTVLMVGLATVLVASVALFALDLATAKVDMMARVVDTIPGV